MSKKLTDTLVVNGFNYGHLEPKTAKTVRSATDRIHDKVKTTLTDIIDIGKEMLAVKQVLPHGMFGEWLKTEFGWGERLAQNFMSVAHRFGSKSEIIADLKIQPTAAYLLAAPSVPDEAREKAVERAQAGIPVSAVAKEILGTVRKKMQVRRLKALAGEKLLERLTKVLERFRNQCGRNELPALARHLREFADSLEKPSHNGSK